MEQQYINIYFLNIYTLYKIVGKTKKKFKVIEIPVTNNNIIATNENNNNGIIEFFYDLPTNHKIRQIPTQLIYNNPNIIYFNNIMPTKLQFNFIIDNNEGILINYNSASNPKINNTIDLKNIL
jgi:hypothetical protein